VKVLVVDDTESVHAMLKMRLELAGMTVVFRA